MGEDKPAVLGTISVIASVGNLRQVAAFLHQCCQKSALSPRDRHDLLLAAEEAYVNVATYAYSNMQGMVTIRCSTPVSGGLLIEIEDEGQAFNPLEHAEPELSEDVHARRIGGLGILLIRKLVDNVRYERCGTMNKLSLLKYSATEA